MRQETRSSLRSAMFAMLATAMLLVRLSSAVAAKEAAPVLTGRGTVPSAILQAVSRTAVEAKYAGEAGVVITPVAPPHDVAVSGSWRLEAKPPTGFRRYGLITSGVRIHLENGAVRTVYCAWSVARQATVWRVRRSVARGEAFTEDLVEQISQPVTQEASDFPAAWDAIAGRVATRRIAAGQVLTNALLGSAAQIRRGQAVSLEAVVGAVRITVPAVALEDGCTGQVIRIQDPQTHRIKIGRVLDAGRVSLIISQPKAQP